MTTISASWALQEALVAYLGAKQSIKDVLGSPARIYDDVPPDAITPFLIIGEDEEDNRGAEDLPGSGHMFAVTVCSAKIGFKNPKLISQAIRDELDQKTIEVEGFEVGTITWHRTSNRRNPDDATLRQSTLVFEVELRPTSS